MCQPVGRIVIIIIYLLNAKSGRAHCHIVDCGVVYARRQLATRNGRYGSVRFNVYFVCPFAERTV